MEAARQAFILLLLLLVVGALSWGDIEWENHGNGLQNNRSARWSWITASTASTLRLRWAFPTGFDVSATPAVADGTMYFPGWNGMLYAVDAEAGRLRWRFNLRMLGSNVGSRATPVVWRELLLVGLQRPPTVVAINRFTAQLVWMSAVLDPTAYSIITMSGTAYQGFYYVGTSSSEEVATCCTFRGSFLKINIKDGSVVWQTFLVPLNSDYYGVAVWGSSPSIDPKRRLVYIATGNNYQVPESVANCELARTQNNSLSPDTCLDPSNHQDSILALSIDSGAIKWSRSLEAFDVWTLACQLSPTTPNCPPILGPDYDFGEAPMIIYLKQTYSHYQKRTQGTQCIVVAGQKSGVVWALDCDTGSIVWSTAAGPGGALGGASWGSCTDGKRVYTNIINNEQQDFVLAPGNEVTRGGGWVAMDAQSGEVIWSVAEPNEGLAIGPVSVSKGVVFGTSYTSSGDVYALDALTGSILWHGTTGAGIYGGVSISHSCIFVGNGYTNLPFIPLYNGTTLSAFCLPYKYP